jgi:hypothetical protein
LRRHVKGDRMTKSTRRLRRDRVQAPVWRSASALVVVVLCALLGAPTAAGRPNADPPTRVIPAGSGCTVPGATPPPGAGAGLYPNQLAAAYDVPSRWQAGYAGHEPTVALLEVGQALDPTAWSQFSACYGPFKQPVQAVVVGSNPTQGGEAIFDPNVVAAIAPTARIYMFESGSSSEGVLRQIPQVLPALLKAALNPANTGGKLVDTISTSTVSCEAEWTPAEINAMQAQLRRAASLGVAVFAAAGDAGSLGSYLYDGVLTCVGWPVDESSTAADWPGLLPGVDYPGSSPEVTSVGGTELQINGVVPAAGDSAGGTITNEIVWNELYPYPASFQCPVAGAPSQPANAQCYFAGGGGSSSLFTVAQAPWQRYIHLSGQEHKPDISSLAGSPNFLQGGIGTSGSAPLMAGAVAVLDGYLENRHAAPTGPLNPTLYWIATKPKIAAGVFNDVTDGSNSLLGLSCCAAGPGYDEASGLGSLNIGRLGAALLKFPSLRRQWTHLLLSAAPASSIGVPEDLVATTNNVIRGTRYVVNLFADGKFLADCKTSTCAASFSPPPPYPKTFQVSADVGRPHAKPFGKRAIASAKRIVTVSFHRPGCKGSSCV